MKKKPLAKRKETLPKEKKRKITEDFPSSKNKKTHVPDGYEIAKKKDPKIFRNNNRQQFIYLLSIYGVTLLTALGFWQYEIKTGTYVSMSEYVFVLSLYIGVTLAIAIKESSREVVKKDWFRKSIFVTFSLMLISFIFIKTFSGGYYGTHAVPSLISQYIGIMISIAIMFWLLSKGGTVRSIFAVILFTILTSPFLWLFWIKIPPWGY